MDLERLALAAVLAAQLGEPLQQPIERLLVAAGVHPAVAEARRAPERGSAWPPIRIGIGSVGTGQILMLGMS